MCFSPKYGYYPDPDDTSHVEYGSYRTATRNYPYVDAETARRNRAEDEAARHQPSADPGERGADATDMSSGPEVPGSEPQSDGRSAEAPRRRKTVLRARQEQDEEEEQARAGTTLLRSRRR